MAAAIGVRGDYDTARLRELAKRSEDANQTRRLLALAAIYDGGSRTVTVDCIYCCARGLGGKTQAHLPAFSEEGLSIWTKRPRRKRAWRYRPARSAIAVP